MSCNVYGPNVLKIWVAVERYCMLFLCYYIFVWYIIKRVWAERVEDLVAELAEVKPRNTRTK